MLPTDSPDRRRWWVVVPVKGGSSAKTRLGWEAGLRARLARAFAADTVAALLGSPRVRGVVLVVRDRQEADAVAELVGEAELVVVVETADTRGDLNAALRAGIAGAAAHTPGSPLAIVLADLPALRADSVTAALDAAGAAGVAVFVADGDGRGTTLLARSAGLPDPRFGPGSAAAHRAAGTVEISALVPADLRRDVDTAADLRAAHALGVGRATAAVLAAPD